MSFSLYAFLFNLGRILFINTKMACTIFTLLAMPSHVTQANNTAYNAIARQVASKAYMEILSNNLANRYSIGFLEDQPLMQLQSKRSTIARMAAISAVVPKLKNRSLKYTYNDLHVAIRGEGFFKVKLDSKFGYTLNGQIFVSKDGYLVNCDGYQFVDRNGKPIRLHKDVKKLLIAEDGLISYPVGSKIESVGILGIFSLDNPQFIRKYGYGILTYSGKDKLAEKYRLIQGALNVVNLDPAKVGQELAEQANASEIQIGIAASAFNMDKDAIEILGTSK